MINTLIKFSVSNRLIVLLMVAIMAAAGAYSLKIATSAGAEAERPLATVVIGGLVLSTVLKLLVLPMLYSWFERDPEGELED